MKEGSVRAEDLKNPTEAPVAPVPTGTGWVFEGTDWAMTYPRSSSGPFHQGSPVEANPEVGVPTASPPTCSVPAMGAPILYANGLAVAMCKFNFVLYIWEGR